MVRNWTDTDGFYSVLDIGGYNYNLDNHAADHKRAPSRIMACTAAEPARVRLTADRTSIHADGQDLSFVTVEAVDATGQPHPNADHQVSFNLKGPGTIAAVGSADMTSEEPYQGGQRKLFHGKALVVVRASRTAGALTLTATAPGLEQATIQIASRRPGR
jgi:beta-galactosidase